MYIYRYIYSAITVLVWFTTPNKDCFWSPLCYSQCVCNPIELSWSGSKTYKYLRELAISSKFKAVFRSINMRSVLPFSYEILHLGSMLGVTKANYNIIKQMYRIDRGGKVEFRQFSMYFKIQNAPDRTVYFARRSSSTLPTMTFFSISAPRSWSKYCKIKFVINLWVIIRK